MLIDSDRVRRERECRAWSQEQLAQLTGLGLRTIQRIESSGLASLESTSALASVFQVSVEDIANRPKIRDGSRIVSGLMVACGLAVTLFLARSVFAEQFRVDVGANVNMGVQVKQTMIADEGERIELEFENQLKAVITPGLVDVEDTQMVSLSLQIYERDDQGQYTLLESPNLVHRDGGDWEIRLSRTPSGNSYRLVVTPRRTSS